MSFQLFKEIVLSQPETVGHYAASLCKHVQATSKMHILLNYKDIYKNKNKRNLHIFIVRANTNNINDAISQLLL